VNQIPIFAYLEGSIFETVKCDKCPRDHGFSLSMHKGIYCVKQNTMSTAHILLIYTRDSSYLVKTGWLTSLSWLEGKVSENLEKPTIFSVSFLATACPLPYTRQTCCTTILYKMQSTSLE